MLRYLCLPWSHRPSGPDNHRAPLDGRLHRGAPGDRRQGPAGRDASQGLSAGGGDGAQVHHGEQREQQVGVGVDQRAR